MLQFLFFDLRIDMEKLARKEKMCALIKNFREREKSWCFREIEEKKKV